MLLASFIDSTGSLSCRCFADMGKQQLRLAVSCTEFVRGLSLLLAPQWRGGSQVRFQVDLGRRSPLLIWLRSDPFGPPGVRGAALGCREKAELL